MRTITTTTDVFTFDELSDAAKDTVRDTMGQVFWDSGIAQDDCEAIFYNEMEDIGAENFSNLQYDCLYSQGTNLRFDCDLPRVMHEGVAYYVTVRTTHYGMVFDLDTDNDLTADEYDAVCAVAETIIDKVTHDLFYAFREHDQYLTSDENLKDFCEGNDYEFTADGHMV